ncbi:DNA lyase [Saccharospirillum impatiens]|uniref:8-oxoguanine DNA glycosylase n=1 Tax=Saccharospirillum impatiens TaxID=169438 RepID=UPI000491E1D8|nr:DNA lyase [Saccharospirillum impatiens]
MNRYTPAELFRAVEAICPDIELHTMNFTKATERSLWWELSTCILGSQVPYDLAVSAANKIENSALLLQEESYFEALYQSLFDLLSTPLDVGGNLRKYRFPESKARQLASARLTIAKTYGSLSDFLNGFDNAFEARSWLIGNVKGLGPKQASMFLRNVGVSYELAILDRHVLNYMSAVGIYAGKEPSISNLEKYKSHEAVLKKHAVELGCAVGLLDWAIWIVMRVANENLEVAA